MSVVWTGIIFVLFPDKAYIPAALSVGGAILLDIITKYYALAKPHGSVVKAIKVGAINSETFYEGTKKKLISFLVLMILCGLSVRVVPISQVAVFSGTLVYTVMFLRECQSILENLLQAGHDDIGWLLPVLKRKEREVLNDYENMNIEESGEDDTNV